MPFSSLKSEFELFEFTELVFGNELIHEHKINKYNVKKENILNIFLIMSSFWESDISLKILRNKLSTVKTIKPSVLQWGKRFV